MGMGMVLAMGIHTTLLGGGGGGVQRRVAGGGGGGESTCGDLTYVEARTTESGARVARVRRQQLLFMEWA